MYIKCLKQPDKEALPFYLVILKRWFYYNPDHAVFLFQFIDLIGQKHRSQDHAMLKGAIYRGQEDQRNLHSINSG